MRSGLVTGDGAVSTGLGYIWPTVTQQGSSAGAARGARGAARGLKESSAQIGREGVNPADSSQQSLVLGECRDIHLYCQMTQKSLHFEQNTS